LNGLGAVAACVMDEVEELGDRGYLTVLSDIDSKDWETSLSVEQMLANGTPAAGTDDRGILNVRSSSARTTTTSCASIPGRSDDCAQETDLSEPPPSDYQSTTSSSCQ
jgi:hypothetical protein